MYGELRVKSERDYTYLRVKCSIWVKKNIEKKCCSILDTKMSGSPIIQNGGVIGAVTHVLVNDPAKGYGIFIEEMLER